MPATVKTDCDLRIDGLGLNGAFHMSCSAFQFSGKVEPSIFIFATDHSFTPTMLSVVRRLVVQTSHYRLREKPRKNNCTLLFPKMPANTTFGPEYVNCAMRLLLKLRQAYLMHQLGQAAVAISKSKRRPRRIS